MHCTGRLRFANASSDECLNVWGFDLDIDDDSAVNCSKHLGKRGNPHPVTERELLQIRSPEFGDGAMCRPLRMSGVHDRIVVNDHHSVASRVHVQLNALSPELDRALKRG